MTMSPQQKAAQTMKDRRRMAAIVAEQDEMRSELAELRHILGRLIDKIQPALEEMLGEYREANGKPRSPHLLLVPDEKP